MSVCCSWNCISTYLDTQKKCSVFCESISCPRQALHWNNSLSNSSTLQASRGTVKPSGNFNSSADAEVLYKAMKGLGKMLVCMCLLSADSVIWYIQGVWVSSTTPTDQWESFLGGLSLWTINVVTSGFFMTFFQIRTEIKLGSLQANTSAEPLWL